MINTGVNSDVSRLSTCVRITETHLDTRYEQALGLVMQHQGVPFQCPVASQQPLLMLSEA